MKKIISMLTMLFLITGCGAKSEKKIMIGLVNFVSGNVFIISADGKETPARSGLPVDRGMKIVTKGKTSLCEIYIDDNVIKLFGDSSVSIDTLTRDKQTNVEKTYLSLNSGRGFFKVKNKLMKDQDFVVKTRTSTAAVRGTEFFVTDEKKSSSVACLDGKVHVKSNKKNGETEIKAKERAVTSEKSKPAKSDIEDKHIAALEKDAEVKPVTEENSKTFKGIEEGDKSILSGMRKKLRELRTPKEDKEYEKDEEKESSGVDLFFFKSKK